jgi:predicted membrane protein
MILLCLALFFFISYDNETNHLNSKKYMPLLWILLLLYFVYQNFNLAIFVVLILILFFSSKKKEEWSQLYHQWKQKIIKSTKEKFENYEIKPFVRESKEEEEMAQSSIHTEEKVEEKPAELSGLSVPPEKENKTAPFQLDIHEIKELYENIKSQIQQLK